ncbi:MAG: PAS domain S-box protein [Alphaproteobacteria bacterium]|jgi:PAS domain S-box-containing protein|nr:PAS domain S-box protein [Alphaproteobacteria bacterium]MBP9868396.1 PAS domain S-box protein [Alphaproteobacteria bacterium]
MAQNATLTGRERFFDKNEIIVSKTDIKGHIQYANPVFMRIGGFEEDELIGTPHSILRHPHMPRCVFKLLWERIQAGQEIFAYVINRAKNGDHYWVLAHVTPSFDTNGKVTGYHSNRRVPERKIIEGTIIPLYQKLLAVEQSHSNSKDGMNAAHETLTAILNDKGVSYDEFIFSLQN